MVVKYRQLGECCRSHSINTSYALMMFQGYDCELSIEAIPCPLSPCYQIVEYYAGEQPLHQTLQVSNER
jgi:hypothetical protein